MNVCFASNVPKLSELKTITSLSFRRKYCQSYPSNSVNCCKLLGNIYVVISFLISRMSLLCAGPLDRIQMAAPARTANVTIVIHGDNQERAEDAQVAMDRNLPPRHRGSLRDEGAAARW